MSPISGFQGQNAEMKRERTSSAEEDENTRHGRYRKKGSYTKFRRDECELTAAACTRQICYKLSRRMRRSPLSLRRNDVPGYLLCGRRSHTTCAAEPNSMVSGGLCGCSPVTAEWC